MKRFNVRHPIYENMYFLGCVGFFMGFFRSSMYEAFTGKDRFTVWYDPFFGIISVCIGFRGLLSSRKNAFAPFHLDTLGGLGLIGAGVYLIVS